MAHAGTYRLHYKKKGAFQRDDAATDWAPRVRARLGELEKRPR